MILSRLNYYYNIYNITYLSLYCSSLFIKYVLNFIVSERVISVSIYCMYDIATSCMACVNHHCQRVMCYTAMLPDVLHFCGYLFRHFHLFTQLSVCIGALIMYIVSIPHCMSGHNGWNV